MKELSELLAKELGAVGMHVLTCETKKAIRKVAADALIALAEIEPEWVKADERGNTK